MYLEKKRQFVGFEKIIFQGEKYSTAKFKDEYFIDYIDLKDKYEFNQTSYYSKGIGMVKFERISPEMEVIVFHLESILTEEEFDKVRK